MDERFDASHCKHNIHKILQIPSNFVNCYHARNKGQRDVFHIRTRFFSQIYHTTFFLPSARVDPRLPDEAASAVSMHVIDGRKRNSVNEQEITKMHICS